MTDIFSFKYILFSDSRYNVFSTGQTFHATKLMLAYMIFFTVIGKFILLIYICSNVHLSSRMVIISPDLKVSSLSSAASKS